MIVFEPYLLGLFMRLHGRLKAKEKLATAMNLKAEAETTEAASRVLE